MTNDLLHEFEVLAAGERLDKLILVYLENLTDDVVPADVSRSQVQAWIKAGHVTVDNKPVKAGIKLKGGETVQVQLPDPDENAVEPQDIPLNIIYEDAHIVVVNKPSGMVVHPAAGNERDTLVNALLFHYPEIVDMEDEMQAEGRMGIVHRLDKDTSGILVTARHVDALNTLMAQFQARSVDKHYLALLEKPPKTLVGTVNAPIARDPKQRKRMTVQRGGKEALTEFEVLDDNFHEGRALVRLKLHTGRTHQIRVHMAFIGCPIVGDRVYGYRKQRVSLKRQFLHAAHISFDHPTTAVRMAFDAPLPTGLQNLLDKLRVST
jgi:23S rRNA pseudouridine1911/1915/1917 synthase